jgi:uncharacterized protein
MSFILRIIIAVVFISLLEYYFVKKVHRAVKEYFPRYPVKRLRKITAYVLMFFNLYPAILTISWLISAIFNVPRINFHHDIVFDYLLTYPFWTGIIIIVQSSLFFLVMDFLKGLILPFAGKYRHAVRVIELRLVPFFIIAFLVYVPFRIVYDYHSVELSRVVYRDSNMPDELKDLRIVLISDVQADKYTNRYRLRRFIERVNRQKPDVVLIAGDFITSGPDYIDLAAEYTGKINATYGVYACVGDHDNWAWREDPERSRRVLIEALSKEGVKMVDDGREYFTHNGKRVGLTIVTHTYSKRISVEVLSTLSSRNEHLDLKIFLTHQPVLDLVRHAYENEYHMFLAGHTHGGQIMFLFPFVNVAPSLIETNYVKGEFSYEHLMIYVTRGLGMSLVPIRYNSTPEITVITIDNKK